MLSIYGNYAKRIGKPDPEVYVDDGNWKARQGGNGLAAAEDVKIRYTNCTAEEHAKIFTFSWRLSTNKPPVLPGDNKKLS